VLLLQGLIFVVDSNDRERLQEARGELERMVRYDMTSTLTHTDLYTQSH